MRLMKSNGVRVGKKAIVLSLLLSNAVFAADYNVEVDSDGLISMYGQNVTVEEIMTLLASKMDIPVSFPSPVPDRVSVEFEGLKLEQAIKEITSSYIIVTSKAGGKKAIKEIIVMPAGDGEASAYLPEEGDIRELLEQEGSELPEEELEQDENRARMRDRIAEIKARTQLEVEEGRRAIELEEQNPDGLIPTPAEMD